MSFSDPNIDVSYNEAGKNGGGWYITKIGADVRLYGAVSYNKAGEKGGGVYVTEFIRDDDANTERSVTCGEVSHNSASVGGGVYVGQSAILYCSDGIISNNTASECGGGVANEGETIQRGSPIKGNTANVGAHDFYNMAGGVFSLQSKYDWVKDEPNNRYSHENYIPYTVVEKDIYCGHCGGRLTLTTSGRKRVRKDGTVIRETRARYQCHYNIRHPGECDGQSGYGVEKLDKLVDQIIRIQLGRIWSAPSQELIAKQQAKEVDLAKSKLNLLNEQYRQKQREYQDLRAETIKVIQGTSRLNVDLLNSLVAETSEQIKQLSWQIQTATAELEETVQSASQVLREYDQLISWAEMYDHCTFEAKKMIVAKFVKAVRVRRDYEIDIEFNVSFEEFQALYLEGEPEEAKRPGTNTILAMETKK